MVRLLIAFAMTAFETASYHYFFERCLKYVSIYKFKFGPTAILRTLGIVNLCVE